MLVRLDPEKEAIAVMSLPRDLKVEIPGHGTDKINAAYQAGGPELTLRTVKQLTGLPINHVINVSFRGFWRAVNAIGCVYADIDHDYYNDSAEYTFIDIDAGYQRLCARKALQYVRFRHTDTDLVRSARQQDFLRQAKQQITTSQLFEQRVRLLRIFGRNTSTDSALRSSAEVLRLLKLAVGTAGLPVQEIHFEGQIGPSYVEATNEQVKKLVQQFLNVEDTPGPRGGEEEKPEPPTKRRKKQRRNRSDPAALGLYDASGLGADQGLQAVQAGAGGSLPVLYPTLLLNSSEFADAPRVYKVMAPGGKRYGAYRMVMRQHEREWRVLRPSGHHLAGRADPRRPPRDEEAPRAGVRAALRGRPAAPGGLAHAQGGLLDLEHAAPDAQREADARDRPLHPALLLS